MREQRRKAEDAKRTRGIVHEKRQRTKDLSHVQNEVGKLMRPEGHPSRQDGRRQGATRKAPCAREMGREGIQDARKARAVRVNATTGGAENRAVGDRHG